MTRAGAAAAPAGAPVLGPGRGRGAAVACESGASNCLPTSLAWELETPEQFEAATRHVPPEEVARNVLVSSDAGALAERLHDYQQLGFESLYLHPVGEDDEFIDVFGSEVLPKLGSPA